MESKAKILGHPIHPILITFVVGLLAMSVIFDIIRFFTGNTMLAQVSFWDIAAGVIAGLLAAVFGLVDWLAIPANTRAKQVGIWHGLGNVVVVALFAVSWILRLGEPNYVPSIAAFVLALVGAGIASVTSWLGGELVDRLGVGVDYGANLDATNSLSGQPAMATNSQQPPAAAATPAPPPPMRKSA